MEKIKDLFKRLKEVRKWRVCIYYNGVLIKTKKMKKDELKSLNEKRFVLNIYNKRQLFNAFKVNIIVRPVVLLHTDEKHKKVYIGSVIEEGISLKK